MTAKKNTTAGTSTLVFPVARVATEIRGLIEAARSHVSVTANLAMVSLYWNIGRIIALDIQKNKKRAEYDTELMEQLAAVLTRDYGQGYSVHNLRDMKRFFDSFVIRQPVAAELLSDEVLPLLLGISDPIRRRFYNLEQFLSELGTDFCFIARQYAMRVDEDVQQTVERQRSRMRGTKQH